MDFYVVGDEDTVVGFRYAGIQGTIVSGPDEAGREFERLAGREDRMIVITTEQTADMVRERINAIRFGETFPLIVEVPGPPGPSPESPSLLSLIREAVGIQV